MSARINRAVDPAAAQNGGGDNNPRITTSSPDASLRMPRVDIQLIRHLRSVYPVVVSRDMSLRDYDISVGRQEVIAHLEALWADQKQ